MIKENIETHTRSDKTLGKDPKITISIHWKTLKTVTREPLIFPSKPTNTDLKMLIKPSTTKNRRDSDSRLFANEFRNGLTMR
jgi:hypothetical protein